MPVTVADLFWANGAGDKAVETMTAISWVEDRYFQLHQRSSVS